MLVTLRGQQLKTFLFLPGTAGNYASTPDSAAVSITGDIDIRVKVAMNDWTPAAAQCLISKDTSGARSYGVLIAATTGSPQLFWATSSVVTVDTCTAAPTVSDGGTIWIRATLDVDNGAGAYVVRYYTSNDGVAWAQLGDTSTGGATTSIDDTNAAVEIGRQGSFGSLLAGKVYSAEIRDGIGGTVVANFDPTSVSTGAASFVAPDTGEIWTINTSGSVIAAITRGQ